MKSRQAVCVTAISALLLAPLAVLAHHSAAVFYLMDQQISKSGVVTEFRMGNPHARIYLDVTDENGVVSQWMAEGGSRTVMLRRGWTGEEVKVGDTVTVHGHPSRDGSNIVHMVDVDLADGSRRFAEDTDPAAISELVRKRRQRGE